MVPPILYLVWIILLLEIEADDQQGDHNEIFWFDETRDESIDGGSYDGEGDQGLDFNQGGDVLQFHDTGSEVYAVHRVWLLRPAQRRAERLTGTDPAQRLITSGCINVSNEVYEKLKKCCGAATLIIQ